jgi:glycine oxidase
MGRVLALELLKSGRRVTIFDRDGELGSQSCGWTGAGMLAPYSELDTADDLVFRLGVASTSLWPALIERLPRGVFFQIAGTLIVAHSQDRPDLARFERNIESRVMAMRASLGVKTLNQTEIKKLEPELSGRFSVGLYLGEEGQVDNRQLYDALAVALREGGANWRSNTEVLEVQPFLVNTIHDSSRFGQVIDCRGLGARADLNKLRGVRGEIIRIKAPEVTIQRPIRLMHPRYPLYIAPREDNRFVVGATLLESEDNAPMTVQSALELLSAAFSVHPGFANASIMEMGAACRPALPDNAPKFFLQDGLMRINGLYRHGFLMAPKLAELATSLLDSGNIAPEFAGLLVEEKAKVASAN